MSILELPFEGTEVVIGRRTYIMPPLTITKLHKTGFYKVVKDFQSIQGDPEIMIEKFAQILEFIFMALQMNYPDVTKEETTDLLDMRSANKIIPYLTDTKQAMEAAVKNA